MGVPRGFSGREEERFKALQSVNEAVKVSQQQEFNLEFRDREKELKLREAKLFERTRRQMTRQPGDDTEMDAGGSDLSDSALLKKFKEGTKEALKNMPPAVRKNFVKQEAKRLEARKAGFAIDRANMVVDPEPGQPTPLKPAEPLKVTTKDLSSSEGFRSPEEQIEMEAFITPTQTLVDNRQSRSDLVEGVEGGSASMSGVDGTKSSSDAMPGIESVPETAEDKANREAFEGGELSQTAASAVNERIGANRGNFSGFREKKKKSGQFGLGGSSSSS
jgi:hypothetical protein